MKTAEHLTALHAESVRIVNAAVRCANFQALSSRQRIVLARFGRATQLVDDDAGCGVIDDSHTHPLVSRIKAAVSSGRTDQLSNQYKRGQHDNWTKDKSGKPPTPRLHLSPGTLVCPLGFRQTR
ncbi:MAG: hypothetical protein E6I16_10095 [Chloroflexi bacterium]|nr:MAG: hypothetical protein E6I16_10095 [Chloroflexota bacterium]